MKNQPYFNSLLRQYSSGIKGFQEDAEVDAKTKTIKFIQLENTNLWRKPPRIDVPPEILPAGK